MGSFFCANKVGGSNLHLPKSVEVTVFIDGLHLLATHAHLGRGLFGEFDELAVATHKLNIDEGNVVFGDHWVRHTTHLDENLAVVELFHSGEVFFHTCLHGIGQQLLHFFATTEGHNARIYGLDNNIAALATFVEFHSR